MNYFQFKAPARQAVFCFAFLFLLLTPARSFAQHEETPKENESQSNQQTIQSTVEKDVPQVAVNQSKFTVNRSTFKAETPAEKDSLELPNSDDRKFTDSIFKNKPKTEAQQTSEQDDTMMGVMGKGTDSIKLGGHVGFVVPIVARGGGVTTNVGDRFVFGFPVGLTVKTRKNIAIDFEFIPTFNTGRDFVLTIHPGIIYGFAKKYAVGVRAAYDAGAGSYGFTPLISRGFKINEKVGFFLEADFPIRSNYRPYQDRFGSIAFAAHAGFAF